jgi:hypothetical protein
MAFSLGTRAAAAVAYRTKFSVLAMAEMQGGGNFGEAAGKVSILVPQF